VVDHGREIVVDPHVRVVAQFHNAFLRLPRSHDAYFKYFLEQRIISTDDRTRLRLGSIARFDKQLAFAEIRHELHAHCARACFLLRAPALGLQLFSLSSTVFLSSVWLTCNASKNTQLALMSLRGESRIMLVFGLTPHACDLVQQTHGPISIPPRL